jgi:hypothetical protein
MSNPIRIKTISPNSPYGEVTIVGQPIISDEEPTAESLGCALWDVLIWKEASKDIIRIYLDGEFHEFGNGSGRLIELNDDLHDFILPGTYQAFDSDIISSLLNCPVDIPFVLTVKVIGDDEAHGILHELVTIDGNTYHEWGAYSEETQGEVVWAEDWIFQGVTIERFTTETSVPPIPYANGEDF